MDLFINGIAVSVTRKNMKTLRLKVGDGVKVTVSAPLFLPSERIISFIEDKTEWIKSQIEKQKIKKEKETLKFISGEKLSLFGKEYLLKIVACKKEKVEVLDNEIILFVKESYSLEQMQCLLDGFYKNHLKDAITRKLPYYERVTTLKTSSYAIRKMKTRWGSCNVKSGKITFNIELAKYPVECLEYVIVHELCHLKHANHKKEFWNLVEKYCPEYKRYRKILKG